MNGVKINKCDKNWNEVGSKDTHNFCKYCEIKVPDFSNFSHSKIEKELPKHTCARFHERHLKENQNEYFFINSVERKMEKYGFIKTTAVLVFVYLLVTGCGNRRRTAGAYSAYSSDFRQHNVEMEVIKI